MESLGNTRKPGAVFEATLESGEVAVLSTILSSCNLGNERIANPFAVITNRRVCILKEKMFGGTKLVASIWLSDIGGMTGSAAGGFGCLELHESSATVKLWFNDASQTLDFESGIRSQQLNS